MRSELDWIEEEVGWGRRTGEERRGSADGWSWLNRTVVIEQNEKAGQEIQRNQKFCCPQPHNTNEGMSINQFRRRALLFQLKRRLLDCYFVIVSIAATAHGP